MVRVLALLESENVVSYQYYSFESLAGTCRCLGTKPGSQSQSFGVLSGFSARQRTLLPDDVMETGSVMVSTSMRGMGPVCETVLTFQCLCIMAAQVPVWAKPSAPCSQTCAREE